MKTIIPSTRFKKDLKRYRNDSEATDSAERELRHDATEGENPSPSEDEWFSDSENIKSVDRGISEMEDGKGKAYTIDEIKNALGV